VISQLERLNSNETKIAPRSVWIAVNGSDLSAPAFMVSSNMDGSDPHFDAEAIATHNTSWDLKQDDTPMMKTMRQMDRGREMADLIHDERGAALAEYALLIALIAVVCVVAVTTLGTSISAVFSSIASSLAAA
jgi:pilus assembly protein Flp/PilA